MGRARTKEDAFTIRSVTIELGTTKGDNLTIRIHPPSQTCDVRSHWRDGEFRGEEHMPLENLIAQLRQLAVAAPGRATPREENENG